MQQNFINCKNKAWIRFTTKQHTLVQPIRMQQVPCHRSNSTRDAIGAKFEHPQAKSSTT
jgi:hypothetical protein